MPTDGRPASQQPRLGGGRRRPRYPAGSSPSPRHDVTLERAGLGDPVPPADSAPAPDPLATLARLSDRELEAARRYREELDRLARELEACHAAQRSHGDRLAVLSAEVEDMWGAHWRAVDHAEVLEAEIGELRQLQANVLASLRRAAAAQGNQRERLRGLAGDHVAIDRSTTTTAAVVGAVRRWVHRLGHPSAIGNI